MGQRIIFHVSIAVLCLMFLGFGTSVHADEKRFFGEIILKVVGVGHKAKSKHTDSEEWESSYEHSLSAGCRIMVCGEEGELNVVDTDRYGTENWEKRFFRQENHKLCEEIWKRKSHIARPGDSEKGTETFEGDIDGPQELPRIEFTEGPNGMYSLYASCELEMSAKYKNESTYHHACDGRNVKNVIQSAPDMPSKADYDKEGNSFMSGPSVPVVRPLLLIADRIGLQGSKTIYERMDKDDGYMEKATASWNLKRTRTSCDCVAFVDMASGDVKVNGKPLKSTILEDPKQISTGAKSRAGITFGNGDKICVGSNNSIDISTVCRSKGTRPVTTRMNVIRIISILLGANSSFHCSNSNAVDGSRGELLPIPGPLRSNIQLASYKGGSFVSSTVSFDEKKFHEVMPNPKDMERAAAALLIEPHHSSFNIWVLKGKLKLKDSTGFSTALQGQKNAVVVQMPAPYHIKAKWLQIKVSE